MRASSVLKRQVHVHPVPIAVFLPRSHITSQNAPVWYATVQTLPSQYTDLYLRHIQPTPVSGGVVYLQPLSDTPRLGRLERLVQRGQAMSVQVVHHQHDPIFVRVVLIDQSLYHMSPVHFRATLSDLDSPPSGTHHPSEQEHADAQPNEGCKTAAT